MLNNINKSTNFVQLLEVCVLVQNEEVTFMSFYDLFVELCEQRGIKPSHVAQACGFNRSNITNWKNGGYTPRGVTLQKIADYFGVPAGYLLGTVEKSADDVSFSDGTGFGGGSAPGAGFGDGTGYGGPIRGAGRKTEKPAPRTGDELSKTKYEQLNAENRAAIDALIDRLLASQSGE